MIHSARPTVSPVFTWNLLYFEKWGRTDGQHVQKQWSLPAVTVGRPRGSIERPHATTATYFKHANLSQVCLFKFEVYVNFWEGIVQRNLDFWIFGIFGFLEMKIYSAKPNCTYSFSKFWYVRDRLTHFSIISSSFYLDKICLKNQYYRFWWRIRANFLKSLIVLYKRLDSLEDI